METIDSLPTISIKYLRDSLSEKGYTLFDLETLLQDPGRKVEGIWESRSLRRGSGEILCTNRARIEIHRDPEEGSLYVDFVYYIQGRDQTRETQRPRYYLRRVESNLIPGTYRYYFVDPYSDRLCSKLYLYWGRILPRSVLTEYGLLYKQQREGHKQRYLWTFYHRCPEGEDLKYRKSHYRGVITPFWSRYLYLYNEGERRICRELLRLGYVEEPDIFPEEPIEPIIDGRRVRERGLLI